MSEQVTIDRLKSRMERFRLGRYERDFQGNVNELKSIYWNCVALDVIDNETENAEIYFQEIAVRLHASFMASFYKAHELHQSIFNLFNGFHKVYRFEEPYASQWIEWEQELDLLQSQNLQLILHSIKEHFDRKEWVKNQNQSSAISLLDFEKYQSYLGQSIYNMFLEHLKHSRIKKLYLAPPKEIEFPFEMNRLLTNSLQKNASKYLIARILKFTLKRVDSNFERGYNMISSLKRATPKDAVSELFEKFPIYKTLPDEQVSHIVRTMYVDPDGNMLKLDSINNALKSVRSQN